MSKDYERKVQTSETLIQVAMIRLLIARMGRKNEPVPPPPLGSKQLPVTLGDDFDFAIDHFYGGLIVNQVRWHRHADGPFQRGPGYCLAGRDYPGAGISRNQPCLAFYRHHWVTPADKVLPDAGGHHHTPGGEAYIDHLAWKLRQEVGQS